MSYEIEVREVRPQPVLSVRERVRLDELSQKFGEFVGETFRYLQAQGAQPAGRPFSRYHGVEGDGIELEVGLPTDRSYPGAGRVQPGELPGGKVAVTTHYGSYEGRS